MKCQACGVDDYGFHAPDCPVVISLIERIRLGEARIMAHWQDGFPVQVYPGDHIDDLNAYQRTHGLNSKNEFPGFQPEEHRFS